MKNTYSIGLIPGDGTGPEVTREAVKVMDAAAQKFGFKLNYTPYDLSLIHISPYPTTCETR